MRRRNKQKYKLLLADRWSRQLEAADAWMGKKYGAKSLAKRKRLLKKQHKAQDEVYRLCDAALDAGIFYEIKGI